MDMFGLALVDPALYAGAVLVMAASGLLRHWINHKTAVRRETERTRRLIFTVPGAEAGDRAAVVRALAQLEAAASSSRRVWSRR